MLGGAAAQQEKGECGNDDRSGTHSTHGLQMDHRNADQHADDVGDQPKQPHEGAELMEGLFGTFVATNIGRRSPNPHARA